MKRFVSWWVVLVAVAVFSGAVAAQEVRIGYVDLKRVLAKSKTGLELSRRFEAEINESRRKVAKEQDEIKELQEQFKRDESIMSKAEKDKRRQEIAERIRQYQRMVAETEGALRQRDRQMMRQAMGPVRELIGAIAKEAKLTAVFDRSESGLLYIDAGMDLTDELIQRLDEKGLE